MQKFEVQNHAPSFLPDGYKFKLVWSDEFDGDKLDESKWDYRLCMMGKRHPAWTDKGVKIENSCAVFSVFEEDGKIVSSQLQTGYNFMDEPVGETMFEDQNLQWPIGKLKENKFTHRYGYYECYCRLQQLPGWWPAFWMQSPMIGASLDPMTSGCEIDIMESFLPSHIAGHNVYTGGYGQNIRRQLVGGDMELNKEEFHRFGVLWLPDKYVFYVDGVEDGTVTDLISGVEEFILITTEVKGYRFKPFTPTEEAKAVAKAGDTFMVDHVRVFDVVE